MGASRAELQVSFSWPHRVPDRHYHRGTLEASQSNFHLLAETAGQRLHRELVLRLVREISPRECISARHKTTKRGRHGQPARMGCDEGAVLRPRPRNRSQGRQSPCCAASKSRP